MEDKESDNNAFNEINQDNENNYNCLLTKIGHKPIIMTSIYSFTQSRPYILLHLISKDQSLKSNLKAVFDNTQKENDLSKELIGNINTYIIYRKIKDHLALAFEELKQKIFNDNQKLNKVIQNLIKDQEFDINSFLNIFNVQETEDLIQNFIDKNYIDIRNTFLELYYEIYSKKYSEFKSQYFSDIYNFNKKYVNHYSAEKLNRQTFFDKYLNHIPIYINRNLFDDIIEKELKKKNRFFLKKTSKELLKKMTYYEYISEQKK